jgi:hypothetical protein
MFFANSHKGFALSHPLATRATNLKHKKKHSVGWLVKG